MKNSVSVIETHPRKRMRDAAAVRLREAVAEATWVSERGRGAGPIPGAYPGDEAGHRQGRTRVSECYLQVMSPLMFLCQTYLPSLNRKPDIR